MQRTTVIQPTTTVEELVQQEEKANDKAIWVVFRKMLVFTVMLTVAPLSSFFLSKYYIFEGMFDMTNSNSHMYAAFVAVGIVHVILAAFLFVAFRDDTPAKKSKLELLKEAAGKKD
ncbi:unnamed protein product [Adineta steineri]|uniref:Vacuolar ATPase assembly integral membrane protein VMA21 homolog n=1 Tax=Adineta steineri TaxID=433720 RepID=A0A818VF68_9BILA|nr:unnamed protein product [Adineta steineri]CAF1257928.1 unnamed protein product [Adineta steineri]CAF1295754.1 unnamed protein product [Adineta steineri]CAF1314099.1 unnamed protein product [Adineta steineri]CAF1420970.1 unnamed protein product [Adineta steineri]